MLYYFPCFPSAPFISIFRKAPTREIYTVSAHIGMLTFFKAVIKLQTLFSGGARKEKGVTEQNSM